VRARASIVCALLSAVLLAGCQMSVPAPPAVKIQPGQGGAVTEALAGSIGALNPLVEGGDNEADIDSVIYQGLTRVGDQQQPVGVLASRWSISDGGRTYTFQLRPGVKWADGRPFSADDVVFTFHLLQDPGYRGVGAAGWREIQVAKVADLQVRFTLKAPSASFPLALRQGIIPRHVFNGVPVDRIAGDVHSNAQAFGTGPFRVASISGDRRIVTLRANTAADPRPNLDQLVFRSYSSPAAALDAVTRGEADAAGALQVPQLSALAKRPDLTVREIRTFTDAALLFNLSTQGRPYFDSPTVRLGLVQAVDRAAILHQVLDDHAQPAPGPIPPTSWAYAPAQASKYRYDPQAAAAALDKAGWLLNRQTGIRSKGGVPFSLTVEALSLYPYLQVANAVSQQLRRLGVEVKVDPTPPSVLIGSRMVTKDYQMALVPFDMGADPDQFALWHTTTTSSAVNFASPPMPRQALIDKDLEDGRATPDPSARARSYADFQDLMSDAAPGIFLFTPHYAYVMSKRVRGVHTNDVIDSVDRLEYVSDWYVNTKGA
jgi:peptide/nickel transport system substrate-binding protein